MQRMIAVLLLAALIVGVGSADEGEPIPLPANCWANNPNWHTLRTINATEPGRTVCVYGAQAVIPCQVVSPKGLPLRRAVVKPDGRVKCVYEGAN